MNLTTAKVLSLAAIAILSMFFGILPRYLVHWFRARGMLRTPRVRVFIAAVICFSGGTLLGVTFLHLMPEMREKMEHIGWEGHKQVLPISDIVTCCGFFFVYIFDELMHMFIEWYSSRVRRRKGAYSSEELSRVVVHLPPTEEEAKITEEGRRTLNEQPAGGSQLQEQQLEIMKTEKAKFHDHPDIHKEREVPAQPSPRLHRRSSSLPNTSQRSSMSLSSARGTYILKPPNRRGASPSVRRRSSSPSTSRNNSRSRRRFPTSPSPLPRDRSLRDRSRCHGCSSSSLRRLGSASPRPGGRSESRASSSRRRVPSPSVGRRRSSVTTGRRRRPRSRHSKHHPRFKHVSSRRRFPETAPRKSLQLRRSSARRQARSSASSRRKPRRSRRPRHPKTPEAVALRLEPRACLGYHDHEHELLSLTHPIDTPAEVPPLTGLVTIIALSFHDIFEGLAIGVEGDVNDVAFLYLSIAAHKYAIAFCIGMDLALSQLSSLLFFVYMFTYSIVSPIGIAVGMIFFDETTEVDTPVSHPTGDGAAAGAGGGHAHLRRVLRDPAARGKRHARQGRVQRALRADRIRTYARLESCLWENARTLICMRRWTACISLSQPQSHDPIAAVLRTDMSGTHLLLGGGHFSTWRRSYSNPDLYVSVYCIAITAANKNDCGFVICV